MSLKAQSGAHSKHVLTYHLVWCVKYRRSVLTLAVGDKLKEMVAEIAAANGSHPAGGDRGQGHHSSLLVTL